MPVSVPSAFYESPSCWLKHLVTALALAAGVAGCSSDTTKDSGTIAWSQPGAATPTGSTTPSGPPLNWQTALSGDTITIELRDRNDFYRVERVELVGPNGITVAASEIDRETNRYSGDYGGGSYYGGGPTVGVGLGTWSGGRHSSTGVGLGLGFPLGGSSSYETPPPVGTITRARIRIPDPDFYRQTAANWVIRITTTDRNNQSDVAVIPAPRPAS